MIPPTTLASLQTNIPMAILFSKIPPPTRSLHRDPSPSTKQRLPVLRPARRSAIPVVQKTKTSTLFQSPAAKNDSLSSTITDLEKEKQDEDDDDDEEDEVFSRGHHQSYDGLAERWREIHGRDDWAGLLDPMDPFLRSELIRYGEMAQACYDGFDFDPFSIHCGCCKFNRSNFFQSLGMAEYGYEVTRYLYATSNVNLPNFFKKSRFPKLWSQRANWIGYVAVSGDEATARLGRRDITIAWRGTVTRLEWVADLMALLRPITSEGIPCPDPSVKVQSGFVDLYTDKDESCGFCKYSAREQILTEVRKLVQQYSKTEEVSISVTGHSLGGALAMLSAYDIAETGLNVSARDGGKLPVCVFSFSGPRVGNRRFKDRFEELGVKALRVVNVHDTVPKVPGIMFNEEVPEFLQRLADELPFVLSYSHVGVEFELDHKNSPFLKDTTDPSCFHNLEAHLHLLDGYHGRGEKFVLASGRDPALVNKGCDFLKDHHLVPPNWRQDENKGMIRSMDGRWMLPERPQIDDHPSDTHHHLQQLYSDK